MVSRSSTYYFLKLHRYFMGSLYAILYHLDCVPIAMNSRRAEFSHILPLSLMQWNVFILGIFLSSQALLALKSHWGSLWSLAHQIHFYACKNLEFLHACFISGGSYLLLSLVPLHLPMTKKMISNPSSVFVCCQRLLTSSRRQIIWTYAAVS